MLKNTCTWILVLLWVGSEADHVNFWELTLEVVLPGHYQAGGRQVNLVQDQDNVPLHLLGHKVVEGWGKVDHLGRRGREGRGQPNFSPSNLD